MRWPAGTTSRVAGWADFCGFLGVRSKRCGVDVASTNRLLPTDNVSAALRDLSRGTGTMSLWAVQYREVVKAAIEELHRQHVEASRREQQHLRLLDEFRSMREERDRLAAELARLRAFLLSTAAA